MATDAVGPSPERSDFYDALEQALAAEHDSAQPDASVVQLLRLLLASYFKSGEFADTFAFAEYHGLVG